MLLLDASMNGFVASSVDALVNSVGAFVDALVCVFVHALYILLWMLFVDASMSFFVDAFLWM